MRKLHLMHPYQRVSITKKDIEKAKEWFGFLVEQEFFDKDFCVNYDPFKGNPDFFVFKYRCLLDSKYKLEATISIPRQPYYRLHHDILVLDEDNIVQKTERPEWFNEITKKTRYVYKSDWFPLIDAKPKKIKTNIIN